MLLDFVAIHASFVETVCGLKVPPAFPWHRRHQDVTLAPAIAPKETGGSPEFPNYPFAHMSRSQTPVVSCPLALAQTGRLPSTCSIVSALGSLARTYLLTTIIHFSEFNDAACVLTLPLLWTPPLSGRTSVRLPTRWLAFGRVGLDGFRYLTHWVTLTSFKSCQLYSHVPSLSRREEQHC